MKNAVVQLPVEPGLAQALDCAGVHVIIDVWKAKNLTDPKFIDQVFRKAAESAGATVLHSHFHHFTPDQGVSGVLVLAESHMSIHTWPDRGYASIDIYMCGRCNPRDALPVLRSAFGGELTETVLNRGLATD